LFASPRLIFSRAAATAVISGIMDSFEARLGPCAWQPADEEKVDAGAGSLVLVVLDVNKELTTSALDWALSCVVQRGDTVKVLGILHHIMNPMGYKSRADENIWNGSSRKILDNECAMKKMMLQSIPHMVSKCEKLGVTALSSLIWFFIGV
jgi:hypothetical protein